MSKPWTVIIYPDAYDDDDDHGYCWAGFATDEADAIEQACRECEATNEWEEGELDADTISTSDCGPHWRTIAEQMARALEANNPAKALELFKSEGGPDGESYDPPPRHVFEVYDATDGARMSLWPVDVGGLDACRKSANEHALKLNAGLAVDRYKVRELGAPAAPDEIAPGQFERCKLAGYMVSPHGFSGYWAAFAPDETEVGEVHLTERAAWEACDRHRMFGEGERGAADDFADDLQALEDRDRG